MNAEDLLRKTYIAFNARNIEAALAVMHPDVDWPNGMEGGRVKGYEEIRSYWTRQWSLIDPTVTPERYITEKDGRIAVDVHQVVRDLEGKILSDAMIQHVYLIENGLIKSMEIRDVH
jgi:ketosteroid isomerase-like protein